MSGLKRRINHSILSVFVVLSGLLAAPTLLHAAQSLTVGLYPWVPRLQQFEDAITQAWANVQPDVSLVFLTPEQWDGGYHMNPPAEADVYVMDAMFLNYFNSIGSVSILSDDEVQGKDDFFAYAIDGVKNPEGSGYLAVPMLGCANVLFYHKDDQAVAQAQTLGALKQTLGTCTFTSMVPPDPRGLMIDMQGASTAACRYIESEAGIQNTWPISLPETIDPTAMGSLGI